MADGELLLGVANVLLVCYTVFLSLRGERELKARASLINQTKLDYRKEIKNSESQLASIIKELNTEVLLNRERLQSSESTLRLIEYKLGDLNKDVNQITMSLATWDNLRFANNEKFPPSNS